MKAIVLDKFGDSNELKVREIPIPEVGDNDVLIRIEYAGVGQWDIFEREGGYDEMLGLHSKFPYILGSEGAGVISAVGKNVNSFTVGDLVYAPGFLNPQGGFYAEFVAVDSKYVSNIPKTITIKEAGVISGVGITALRGLEDILMLKRDESIVILGASGGVGYMAVQLALNMGARVFAIASGKDGVTLLEKLGVDAVVDGRGDEIIEAVMKFAPNGFDTALFTAGGELADTIVSYIRTGGRIAYPYGIYPIPQERSDMKQIGYYGDPEPVIIKKLNKWISDGKLKVHIDQTFLLEEAVNAHRALDQHYLGKLCLQIKH